MGKRILKPIIIWNSDRILQGGFWKYNWKWSKDRGLKIEKSLYSTSEETRDRRRVTSNLKIFSRKGFIHVHRSIKVEINFQRNVEIELGQGIRVWEARLIKLIVLLRLLNYIRYEKLKNS